MRELGNLAVLPPGSEGAIRMVFIDYFKESVGKNAGAKKDDGVGLAIVPLEYFEKHVVLESGGDDLDPGLVGLMFISQAPLAGGMVFNGRTIAHEIAHVVVGQSNGPSGDRSHVYVLDPQTQKWGDADEVNILRANSVEPESIRRKRFNAVQEALLQRSIYVTPVTTP
jgi:hypothetical protein